MTASVPDLDTMVRDWSRAAGRPVRDCPTVNVPRDEIDQLLMKLHEEFAELSHALQISDVVATADALGDLVYVLYGFAAQLGISLNAVLHEVHKSNLTKLDSETGAQIDELGNIGRGPNYVPPDIASVLKNSKNADETSGT